MTAEKALLLVSGWKQTERRRLLQDCKRKRPLLQEAGTLPGGSMQMRDRQPEPMARWADVKMSAKPAREAGPARRYSGFAVAGLTNRIQDEQEVPRMSYVLEQ